MKTEADLQRIAEVLECAIRKRFERLGGPDSLCVQWNGLLKIVEWFMDDDSNHMVDDIVVSSAREELGIHPGGL